MRLRTLHNRRRKKIGLRNRRDQKVFKWALAFVNWYLDSGMRQAAYFERKRLAAAPLPPPSAID